MALPAINLAVLAFQPKSGGGMFKRDGIRDDGPAVGGMAGGAVHLEGIPMRRLAMAQHHRQ